MNWISTVILLLGFQCIRTTFCLPPYHTKLNLDEVATPSLSNDYYEATGTGNIDMDNYITGLSANKEIEDEKLQQMGNYLTEMLMFPRNGKGLPLVYIDDDPDGAKENSVTDEEDYPELSPRKRSRYYRKYPWKRQTPGQNNNPTDRSRYTRRFPWKRQTSRTNYDAETRYLCQPSRDDVFRLLVAIHDTRQDSSNGHNINFCNRKRPAKSIFTNIRFLG